MWIFAIDPGNEQSAALIYDTIERQCIETFLNPNMDVLFEIDRWRDCDELAIEMVASYGMAVGKEVFETCVWIGRFVERWSRKHTYIYRKDVKMHLCHSMRATDANIRAALIDRFGPGKEKAVGNKTRPGPLYNIKKDLWSALAVAVTYADTVALGGSQ